MDTALRILSLSVALAGTETLHGIGLSTWIGHLLLGACTALFMAGFDIALARRLLRRSWPRELADFNPANGNGLAGLVLQPALVWQLRAP